MISRTNIIDLQYCVNISMTGLANETEYRATERKNLKTSKVYWDSEILARDINWKSIIFYYIYKNTIYTVPNL